MNDKEKQPAVLNYEEEASSDVPIGKQKKQTIKESFAVVILFILHAVLPVVIIGAVIITIVIPYIFSPHVKRYPIAIQLENGVLIETDLHMQGAVNRKNEFLIDYNPGVLVGFVGLYLDDYVDIRGVEKEAACDRLEPVEAWVISDADNPYYDGEINYINENYHDYVTTETVYDSINKSHRKDTFYDSNGKVVWEFEGKKKGNNLFQTVIETNIYVPGESISTRELYINVNQFLIKQYGLKVETIYDNSNKLLIFKVPKVAVSLP